MLTPDDIQKRLQDRNLHSIAQKTGLSYDTVWKIANGKSLRPSYDAIRKISDYLEVNK